ncbi:MAG: hypothetical protein ACRDNW_16090 [Trebonia sp.]
MSFSEPGRDDGNLPPVNIVIPDDARDLDRDVLAYRREVRAERRRQRIARLFRPLRVFGFGGHTALIPLIAACLAISLVGGALLSVVTTSPASAPTLTSPQTSATPAVSPQGLTELPAGSLQLSGHAAPVRSLVTSAIAVVPANCGCGTALARLATQAVTARVRLYFAGTGAVIPQLPALAARYGDGTAVAAADADGVLSDAYHPAGLTVLLVFKDATAKVIRNLPGNFQLTPILRKLVLDGASLGKG